MLGIIQVEGKPEGGGKFVCLFVLRLERNVKVLHVSGDATGFKTLRLWVLMHEV